MTMLKHRHMLRKRKSVSSRVIGYRKAKAVKQANINISKAVKRYDEGEKATL